ncbi:MULTISPECIES: YidC/Oxa1 family membrane protein insertase [Streptomyces]|uniref:Membrane protein insertase YidC n=2 Tax=Streptomyces TaxID=1883 RepID=A0ABU2R1Z4_9ACTN|nr:MULTISPECIES: YidC/Oxa1 family membrane protein insertase [unclassified Streptomyces]MDT0409290.1 YidC/Oxa1 family membrane protein insertase [Streptomyces sp. DSM 41979]MYQ61344.1 membrane protein insertase YidC [Streptomyces sp. SID4926]SCD43012.1 YidC/Oxa1 family membrane protein insertase [Streptomyces sp. TverLS-915]SCE47440.1 YidC/Oxa1 family membrane protein insertase [Streptomyces sp. DfronAA-171]
MSLPEFHTSGSGFLGLCAGGVDYLADLLQPLAGTAATAAAIVVLTACVRLLLLPLSRTAARGQRERAGLAPEIAALRRKYAKNPERMQRALTELHAEHGVSPLGGCLPMLCQLPFFFVLYHVFSSSRIGGEPNRLLPHRLFAAPLGGHWGDALAHGGPFGERGLVYVALFALVAAVATFTVRRNKRQLAGADTPLAAAGGQQVPGVGALTRFMPYMAYFTLISVAVVPLAGALYIVTSTTWSAVERAVLYRERGTAAEDAGEATGKDTGKKDAGEGEAVAA